MYAHTRMVVATLGLLVAAGCGGSGSGGGEAAASCTPGATSVPNMPDDPCIQTGTQCATLMGQGIAMCDPTGTWGQCQCVLPNQGSSGTQANGVVMTPDCGNGIVEPDKGEECERGKPGTVTCASMFGTGATGLVQCSPDCKLDLSMCMAPAAAPASTGSGGAGAMMTGTAGAGM